MHVISTEEAFGSSLTRNKKPNEQTLFVPGREGCNRPYVLTIAFEKAAVGFSTFDFETQYEALCKLCVNYLRRPGDTVVVSENKDDDSDSVRFTRLPDQEKWSAVCILVTRA